MSMRCKIEWGKWASGVAMVFAAALGQSHAKPTLDQNCKLLLEQSKKRAAQRSCANVVKESDWAANGSCYRVPDLKGCKRPDALKKIESSLPKSLDGLRIACHDRPYGDRTFGLVVETNPYSGPTDLCRSGPLRLYVSNGCGEFKAPTLKGLHLDRNQWHADGRPRAPLELKTPEGTAIDAAHRVRLKVQSGTEAQSLTVLDQSPEGGSYYNTCDEQLVLFAGPGVSAPSGCDAFGTARMPALQGLTLPEVRALLDPYPSLHPALEPPPRADPMRLGYGAAHPLRVREQHPTAGTALREDCQVRLSWSYRAASLRLVDKPIEVAQREVRAQYPRVQLCDARSKAEHCAPVADAGVVLSQQPLPGSWTDRPDRFLVAVQPPMIGVDAAASLAAGLAAALWGWMRWRGLTVFARADGRAAK